MVLRGVVIVEGWSEVGAPALIYDGRLMSSAQSPDVRHGLSAILGPGADSWGFRTCGLSPETIISHEKLRLVFSDGTIVDAPGIAHETPQEPSDETLLDIFVKETKRGGRLLEIGSRARSGYTYRHLFSSAVAYTGVDVAAGPNVDVVGDAHHLRKLVEPGFDFVFSTAVFEHILMPWKVAIEMAYVMNIGGMAYIRSHAAFPLHEQPWDFWRFSKDAWSGIFNKHTGFEVIDSAYGIACSIVPHHAAGGALQNMDTVPTYLMSSCLVRKITPPLAEWELEVSEVYDLKYNH